MLAKRLRSCSCIFIYSALIFSVLWRGSDVAWRLSVLQTLVFLSFFFYSASSLLTGRSIWAETPLIKPLIVCGMIVFVSGLTAENMGLAFQALLQLLSCAAAFFVCMGIAVQRDEQRRMLTIVSGTTLGLCGFGLLIHFKIFLFPSWELIHAYQHGNLSATFINHCHMAGWLEMAILLFIPLLFIRQKKPAMVGLLLCGLAVMMVSLILTLSRGGWFSSAVGLCFLTGVIFFHDSFRLPKRYFFVFLTIFFAAVFFILGNNAVTKRSLTVIEQDTSSALSGRTIAWEGTIDMIKAYPLTGVGPGNYATAFTRFQPPGSGGRFFKAHNDYLEFIAEAGLFLLPSMIWLIVVFFKKGFQNLKHPSRQTRWITLGAMGGILSILVHSLSDFNLQIPSNALLFCFLAAQVAAPAPALKKKSLGYRL